ncbi:hypothetical protein PR048_028262 [Dryococelus australis]|uniref:Uncharacterized protein n=1 Tax=Dryococelus australis TaxID=614101 RepID=A0ABQ9GIR0_9NEOP|nr:hypothetical protein PR048_028262 [Dryococelus australis]
MNGYLARKLLQETKYSKTCSEILLFMAETPEHEENIVISSRAYSPKALCCPSTMFSKTFNSISEILASLLPVCCHHEKVWKEIATENYGHVDMTFMKCKEHDLKKLFTRLSVRFLIHAWCNNVNKILSGKIVYHVRSSPQFLRDPIKKQAFQKFLKRTRRRK